MNTEFNNNQNIEFENPVSENTQDFSVNSEANEPTEAGSKAPKKKKFILPIIIVAAVALVALLVAAGIFVYNTFFKTEPYNGDLFGENLLCVKDGDKWGYVNKNGKYVIKAKYDKAFSFAENGLARIAQFDDDDYTYYYGYINKKGDTVVKAKYLEARDFSECGLAAVKNVEGEWGAVDKNGEVVISLKFANVEVYDSGVIIVRNNKGKAYLVDKKGEDISEKYDSISWNDEAGVGVVVDEDEYGLINAKGKEILELTDDFDSLGSFNENGIGRYVEDEYYGVINSKGKILTDADFDYISYFNENDLAVFRNEDEEYGIINSRGKEVVKAGKYADIESINDGWFIAMDEDEETMFLLNEKCKEVFSFEEDGDWYMINDFAENGLAPIEDEDEMCGFINRKGKIVINCKYYNVYSFSLGGLARVVEEEGDEFSFINEKGKSVGGSYIYATNFFDDGYAVAVEVDGGEIIYKIINEKGKKVCQIDCDDILLPSGKVLSSAIEYILDSDDFDKKEFLINYIEENVDEEDLGSGFDNVEEYVDYITQYMGEEALDEMIKSIVSGNDYFG